MKYILTVFVVLLLHTVHGQDVNFFGKAICKTTIKTLYYRFDDESFSPEQSVQIERSNKEGARILNSYGIEFKEDKLRAHQYIYFSHMVKGIRDTVLIRQNRVNLMALFALIDSLDSEESVISVTNDLFLEDNFEQLTGIGRTPSSEEKQYIGEYMVSSNFSKGTTTIRLDDAKIYHAQHSNERDSYFFMNEEIGTWELGSWHYNNIYAALKVKNIYSFNRNIGLRMLPADIGSAYDIRIKEDRLLYPTGFESMKELKRK
ncbi:hypothetical protein [Sphingobacterium tabacisoli]|uniref:Uncharacterized protein n=1 Tax=Sphingobacterium tabacisoli TaxID=2044855 RepID=A0ABW5L5Y0_9SPHI|nr:hypothetical protein [Sphingobacterium tabacisoli]